MVTVVGGGGFKGSEGFTGAGFRVEFERTGPGPYQEMVDQGVAVRGASVEAVVKTTQTIKERIRDYIDGHFGNSGPTSNGRRRASNASAQSVFYDELEAKGQYAGLVYSKFGKRDAGGFVDFLLLHMRGGTVSARGGNWLRILSSAARQRGDFAARTGAFGGSDVFFRPSADGNKLYLLRKTDTGGGGGSGMLQLIATLVKAVVVPGTLGGITEIARQRPELFEGYFAEALSLRQQQTSQGASS